MRKMRDQVAVGKLLKARRKAHKITLNIVVQELERLNIKCSRPNLGRIEKGNITLRADILAALCHIYEVSMEEIMFSK